MGGAWPERRVRSGPAASAQLLEGDHLLDRAQRQLRLAELAESRPIAPQLARKRIGQRSKPALDPEVDELAFLLDRQLAREQQAARLLGVDDRLEHVPPVAGTFRAQGGERTAARLADQLLLARGHALVLLRLVPAVGIFRDVAQ